MTQITAHKFPDIYKELDIDLNELNCIMLDLEPLPDLSNLLKEKDLYYSKTLKYAQGLVASKTPHATLRYGLLPQVRRKHVDAVLESWQAKEVRIQDIGMFESVYEGEEYYCIVAHLDLHHGQKHSLLEANQRLSLLPNVNTFSRYKAHLTIAYVKKSVDLRVLIDMLGSKLQGETLKATGLNYGDTIK